MRTRSLLLLLILCGALIQSLCEAKGLFSIFRGFGRAIKPATRITRGAVSATKGAAKATRAGLLTSLRRIRKTPSPSVPRSTRPTASSTAPGHGQMSSYHPPAAKRPQQHPQKERTKSPRSSANASDRSTSFTDGDSDKMRSSHPPADATDDGHPNRPNVWRIIKKAGSSIAGQSKTNSADKAAPIYAEETDAQDPAQPQQDITPVSDFLDNLLIDAEEGGSRANLP